MEHPHTFLWRFPSFEKKMMVHKDPKSILQLTIWGPNVYALEHCISKILISNTKYNHHSHVLKVFWK